MRCPNCHSTMTLQALPEYDVGDLLGLPSVLVRNLPAFVCRECKDVIIPGPILDTLSSQLVLQILSGNFPLGGVEVKFLRKAVRLTQQQLADLLGVERVTVARWETGESPPSPAMSIAVRTVIAANEKAPVGELPKDAFRSPPTAHPPRFELDAPPRSVAGL